MAENDINFDPTGGALLFVAFISIVIWLFCFLTYFGVDTGTMAGELKPVLILTGIAIGITALKAYCACNIFAFPVLLMVALGVILAAYVSGFYINLAIGMIFLVMMVWWMMTGGAKALSIILIATAFIFIFGECVAISGGSGGEGDVFVLLKGVAALINMVFSIWLGFALLMPDKVKAF